MSSVNTARLRLEHHQDTLMLSGCSAGWLIAALRSRIKTSGCHSCRRDDYRPWQLNPTTIDIACSFPGVNVLRRRCPWYHCTPLQYLARCTFLNSHRSRLLTPLNRRTDAYCNLAAAVLFVYDALLTFDRDLACFGKTRWTAASLLFFANKGISLTSSVLSLIWLAPFSSDEVSHRSHCIDIP
ncbi:hypothetical protein OH76DRAFT_560917 [Lentinus brumalis]|uniref:DUF6533 domain-containing protein n=1 Tax=Lentinus brumalis TaxID=2498619 RepID=A0A371D9I4_9APHY|nr:hypothetical protein OH76DRAFT_560917 [Polyporus brumalis]